jgi:hypothetical protein
MRGSEVSTGVVKWSVAGWSLNKRKWSFDRCSEGKCSWVKFSLDLSNRVSNIISRYIDHMKFAAYMTFLVYHILVYSFGYILYHFICILIIMYFYCYVMCYFVSLSILIVMYVPFCVFCLIVLFCVLFVYQCALDYYHRGIGALFDYPNWGFSVLFPQL